MTLLKANLQDVAVLRRKRHAPTRDLSCLGTVGPVSCSGDQDCGQHRQHEYRYYVLDGDLVVAGFDNAADPRATDLEYGKQASRHYGESIPHLHHDDKTAWN